MATVNMPNDAILVRWYRSDGDIVRRDEPICEIATEQATVDVPAVTGGILRQLAKAGDRILAETDVFRIDPE